MGEDFTLRVRPKLLAFDLNGQRIRVTDMDGRVAVDPAGMRLEAVHGRFDGGRVQASGDVRLAEPVSVDLSFTAEADRFGPTTRAVLPPALTQMLEELEFDGAYRVVRGRLQRGGTSSREPDLTVDATLELTDASAMLAVPIRELNGRLDVRVRDRAGAAWPHLELNLNAERVRVADRLIEPLEARLSTTGGVDGEPVAEVAHDALVLDRLVGSIYDGALVGRGIIQLGRPGRYEFDLTLSDVEVERFMNPLAPRVERAAAAGSETQGIPEPFELPDRAEASGLLSASLQVHAEHGRPDSRVGRGAFEVRDAALFDKPLAMAMLQAINFSLPAHRAFDRASGRFSISGDRVLFDRLSFQAPTLELAGTGWLDYPTHRLNLTMLTRNPGAPNLGPISQVFRVFKDELVAVKVTGTLAEPEARVVSFEGVSQSWKQVFGESRHADVDPDRD